VGYCRTKNRARQKKNIKERSKRERIPLAPSDKIGGPGKENTTPKKCEKRPGKKEA